MPCRSPSIAIGTRVFWTDREPSLEEQLTNKRSTNEVGRALDELGITLHLVGSAQAKGRIGRLWGTFQDRFVSELRLANAKLLSKLKPCSMAICPSMTESSPSPLRHSPLGEKPAHNRSNRPRALKKSVRRPTIYRHLGWRRLSDP